MKARGFTLIEALVAFTILAVVTGVTAQAMSGGLSQVRRADAAAARIEEARAILEGLGTATPLAPGVLDAGPWRLEVALVAGGDGAPGLYRADLTMLDDGRAALSLSVLRAGD